MSSVIPSAETAKQVLYDSLLTTGGAMAIAFAAVKLFGERFGIPMSMNGAIMFAIAIFLGNLFVNLLQRKNWIKEDM